MGEILEAASSLLGDAPAQHEGQFIADVTKLLADTGRARRTGSEIGAREVAETPCATSHGLKHQVAPAEYRARMAIALRIALAGTKSAPSKKR